jgi:hypothetical protein
MLTFSTHLFQEFESFVGDQHYPPPRGTPQAGPSGMTLTPTVMTPGMTTSPMDGECALVCFYAAFECVSLTKDGPEPYFYHINKPLTWHLEEGFNSQLHTQSMGNR